MTTSTKPAVAKKKTVHVSATTTAAPAAASATTPSPANPDYTALAASASALVQQLTDALPFFDPSAKDLLAARVANRVPATALGVAAKILEANPDRYPDFDAESTRAAADYTTEMTGVAEQIDELHQRLSRSILNRHGQGAADTLALYQTLKGLARVSKGKDTLVQQKALAKALAATRKKSRATAVTKKELQGAAKAIKATKVSATKAQQAAVLSAEAQAAAPPATTATSSAGGASSEPATPLRSTATTTAN